MVIRIPSSMRSFPASEASSGLLLMRQRCFLASRPASSAASGWRSGQVWRSGRWART